MVSMNSAGYARAVLFWNSNSMDWEAGIIIVRFVRKDFIYY
jgi:hypothetical protein